ncbi:hypothetical protein [Streptomyces filamentosus]|uniref:hypothetical protein n=1 Tax=Streptomyces filamentosus TaxID=67294 RepID=UPI0033C99B45
MGGPHDDEDEQFDVGPGAEAGAVEDRADGGGHLGDEGSGELGLDLGEFAALFDRYVAALPREIRAGVRRASRAASRAPTTKAQATA